jgi:hypothetical protein
VYIIVHFDEHRNGPGVACYRVSRADPWRAGPGGGSGSIHPEGERTQGRKGELVPQISEKIKKKKISKITRKGVDINSCMCYNEINLKEVVNMNGKKTVIEIMKLRGFTIELLSKKLGYKTVSGVSERLRGSQDMRVDTLVKFLEQMDCELVIRSTTKDKTEWKISADSE